MHFLRRVLLGICADPERFVRGGQTLNNDNFFLFLFFLFCFVFSDEGRVDPKTTISRPSSARQRAVDGPTLDAGFCFMLFQGIWTSIAKKPYNFVIFRGRGSGLPVPPFESAHEVALFAFAKKIF